MKVGFYKKRCHELIDDIWGNDKGFAYQWLHRKFGGDIHFATLHNEELLRLIYEELLLIHSPNKRKHLKLPQQIKKPKSNYKQMFTDKKVLREVGRLNSLKVLPWYKKLFHVLCRPKP